MSTTVKCAICGKVLSPPTQRCPKCGSFKRAFSVVLKESIALSDNRVRLRYRSGKKDYRGKCLREIDIKKNGSIETTITVDRSKRLKGKQETDVYHKVTNNGKIIHGPHLEPRKRKRNKK